MVNIAVLGYGTVGSGVAEVIRENRDIVNKNAGDDINVKYVLDLREFPGDPVEKVLTHDFEDIINDPEVKIVVEVMGGLKPAYDFVKRSLLAGKSVCSSNKELVARHGPELLEIARENKANFLFEASCGGGIPLIRPLCSCLTADRIEEISGILNGTTNYILYLMETEGRSFEEALKSAQDNGFAEKNPEADIEGFDASRKLAILSSIAFGKTIDFNDIYTEGISRITEEDIDNAAGLGYAVKLIASCAFREERHYAFVAPMLIERGNPLSCVNGVLNAVLVKGNMLGPIMLYGSGAGKLPTASAVVSDIIDEAKNLGAYISPSLGEEKLTPSEISEMERSFYVRLSGSFEERKSEIEGLFGNVRAYRTTEKEACFITKEMKEKAFFEAYGKLEGALGRIRVN